MSKRINEACDAENEVAPSMSTHEYKAGDIVPGFYPRTKRRVLEVGGGEHPYTLVESADEESERIYGLHLTLIDVLWEIVAECAKTIEDEGGDLTVESLAAELEWDALRPCLDLAEHYMDALRGNCGCVLHATSGEVPV